MQSLKKSTCKLSQQAHISRAMCWRVLKSLDLKPYRVMVVQQLQEADVKRVNYCMWLLNSICVCLLHPFQYIMSDEAWFHLCGHVNSQNMRYWAAEIPHLVHEQHDKKNQCLVCCVRGAHHWTDIFWQDCQHGSLCEHFWRILSSRQIFFSQQYGVTCHTSRASLQRVHDVFSEEQTVSKNLWPPHSPDLTASNYFLWGHLKSTVYELNPHTVQELKDNISHAVAAIKITILHREYLNMIRRAQLCIDAGGNHFQHLLWWFILSAFGYCINFCITLCYGPGLLFRGPSCIRLTEIAYWRYQNFISFVQITVSFLIFVFPSSIISLCCCGWFTGIVSFWLMCKRAMRNLTFQPSWTRYLDVQGSGGIWWSI